MDIHCWKVVAAVATDPNIEAAPLWARVDQSHGRKSFQVSFEGGLSTQHCDFHAENDDKPSKFEVPYFKINSSFSEEISFRNLLQKTSMTLEVLQQDLRN